MKYKNNPCNIRFSKRNNWLGQIEPCKGFCQFDYIDNGVRACIKILKHYRNDLRLCSIRDIISRWAPNSENDTERYIGYVASCLGCSSSDNLPCFVRNHGAEVQWCIVVQAIAWFETNTILDADICSVEYLKLV